MQATTQAHLRRFAPVVLAVSLLFLGLTDAGASCLAAWLCSRPAAQECQHGDEEGAVWSTPLGVCTFEARVDGPGRKHDPVELQLLTSPAPVAAAASARFAGTYSPASFSGARTRGAGSAPPLYQLHGVLLI